MSHIHIPDGVLPPVFWISGYILTIIIIYILTKKMGKEGAKRKAPYAGITAAIMLIAMSIPLGFIPLHFSLAVLCGILLGPGLGFITVFVVTMILAFFGHGGITVVGLNTLIIGTEVLIGYYLFTTLRKHLGIVPGVVIATITALVVSVAMMVTVLGVSVGIAEALPHNHSHAIHDHDHEHDNEHDCEHDHEHAYEDMEVMKNETLVDAVANVRYINFTGWGAVFTILIVGILLETLVTTLIVKYFMTVRPDFISPVKAGT